MPQPQAEAAVEATATVAANSTVEIFFHDVLNKHNEDCMQYWNSLVSNGAGDN